ncbi:MAG: hypothetical protein QXP58_07675 [Thermoprotei archaeon]
MDLFEVGEKLDGSVFTCFVVRHGQTTDNVNRVCPKDNSVGSLTDSG